MRLHRMTLTAFGPFGGVQEVDFGALSEAGLFLLHGPTGAGKTSVLDAVCYALYGSVPGARQSAGTTLRSDHAAPGARTEVVLELTVAGRHLEIGRQPQWMRPKKRGTGTTMEKAQSWLREYDSVAGAWKDLSRSHQEIGEEIGQLLGMSKEQFCQVVLLPQGDFARFLRADAEARGKLLGRLFDTRRFAAVEQHLAELRRGTEAQVRAADERLLAVAQRMGQAAGRTAELPLPELAAGEPGVAEAVLTWAACARSAAREALAVARVSQDAAQRERAAAQADLDAVRETYRLQRRHAEAQERAARLAEHADAHRADRERMERARKAEAVAPALSLRSTADAALQRAAGEEQRARRMLPESFAGAEAAALAAAARKAHEELGSLASARRGEQRLRELGGELVQLEQEERSDAAALEEASEWLADWDAVRHAHQTRIDEAQEAATRAGQLEGRIDPAREQLDAARRRDALTASVAEAQEEALAAGRRAGDAREHWLTLKEQRLRGIAAELAAQLTDGDPCAVCGSVEHPAPARRTDGHVDRQSEEAALAAYQRADQERTEVENTLSSVREALAAATASAGGSPTEELAGALGELEQEYTQVRGLASTLHAVREAFARDEHEHDRRIAARQDAERRAASRTSRREHLAREQAVLQGELAQARGGAASVADRARQLERQAELLTEAAEAARAAQEAAERLKEADGRLAEAAYKAGFDTPQSAAAAALDDASHRALQHRLDAWQQEDLAVRAVLAEPDTQAAAQRPAADPAESEQAAERAEQTLRRAVSAQAAAEERCRELDRLSRSAAGEARQLAPLRAEYDRVARMATLAAGTSADNERRMRLESYVLAARLEQVAAAATMRLQRMSAGRYTLVHSDDRAGRGARSGLGLHVIDAWTGRERDTATLSGGETFFASLALALGLADVVTDEAGGVRLDTLFIDEGFGSLDDQTLDEVLDVLDSLRERDRSVGIVSHVADLRRRVHAQLEVVKGRAGSVVRQRGISG
ncbi:SMC family ATPase [Streptomyces sp. TRM66268-LWL]|uniref:Nuclease SbcCD subunit C n=1 Tax=Streptomyces polyasparticus TaxID=2767826 RepID=A0ABR7SH74_9ACTN|nr:SMC family ATPase [Streptomyces polyasparticus]MBC9714861.1 SMC family ATPase [Streptomyces polyasparticus]